MFCLLHVMLLLLVFGKLHSILYDTDHFQFDCLYYYLNESPTADLVKYCIRPANNTDSTMVDVFNPLHRNFTFDQLYRLNITSPEILLWSSSIDLAERYQDYVDELGQSRLSDEQFFNCTPPWFGVRCQYSFELNEIESLLNLGETSWDVQQKSPFTNAITYQTCYILIECDRGGPLMCLDWREVCDGRIDCLNDGVDEIQCSDLEINECNENEYQCHNGLCIPNIFFDDDYTEAECLDQSDLLASYECPKLDGELNIFACEENTCRPGEGKFSCGDGQCVKDFDECYNGRHLLLAESISVQGNLSPDCWIAIVCLTKIIDHIENISCEEILESSQIIIQLQNCQHPMQFPTMPVVLGHIRFLYDLKEILNINRTLVLIPNYICYDEHLCDFLTPTFHHGTLTCRFANEIGLGSNVEVYDWKTMIDLVKTYFHGCVTRHYQRIDFQYSSLYSCQNSSKMISKRRLVDSILDCPLNDDEKAFDLSCSLGHSHRFRCSNETQCRSPLYSQDICPIPRQRNQTVILFFEICDRIVHLSPIMIDGQYHSDETDCKLWPCNNIYTRCDGFWSCADGKDEENCDRFICPAHSLPCVIPHQRTVECLPAAQVGDAIIDCLGASDELQYCQMNDDLSQTYRFQCWNSTICVEQGDLCNGYEDCPLGDDELFCANRSQLCDEWDSDNLSDVQYILCRIGATMRTTFSLETALIYPSSQMIWINADRNESDERRMISSLHNFSQSKFCNYGFYVHFWVGLGNYSNICFCPPNYYGDRCQYQNQRVSLTLTLATAIQPIVYAIVVTLIEDDENRQEIHSYQQFIQVPKIHCSKPINIYLLYSYRPKDSLKKYSVRIDAFDKRSLTYLASWHLAIPFIFLPVNRFAAFLTLPIHRTFKSSHCSRECHQGTCMKYLNEERLFCRCYSGWSGAQCRIPIDCSMCSSDSICVGSIHNQALCVCPLHKFGSRCLLEQACPRNFCENNGQCIVLDQRMINNSYTCLCSKLFFGVRCERVKHQIEVSFENIEVSSYFFAYVYNGTSDIQPIPKFVILQKVTMFQSSVTLYSQYMFNMIFLKIDSRYYLAVLQRFKLSSISTSIGPPQRCPSIHEFLTPELLTVPRIHLLKSYHILCQHNLDLQCFVDEFYMCLCTEERHSNCFLFDHDQNFVCQENVYCENGGTCLQDKSTCLSSILCVCIDCFFGDRCQFYAKGTGLTLDDILRYVIRPNTTMNEQSFVVKLSAVLIMIVFITGLLNSLFAFLVFYHKNSRKVGCGVYLLLSSIISALVVSMLTIKFWFVVFTHIKYLISRDIHRGGCILIEPTLKLLVHMNNWLNACIAIERAVAVFKGINFNKRRSKHIARWTLRLLPFIILGSISHEFVYRDLFDDYEEQRVWCVFRYSPSIEKYSIVIQLFHFVTPFAINLFSALFIIFKMAHQRATIRTQRSYEQQLFQQFNQHKQLIVSPIILIILSFPRLLISLLSGCVKESRTPWLYLSGYIISFTPSAFVFIIFVLPSTSYRKQFTESINSWRRRMIRF